MTTELTLREKVRQAVRQDPGFGSAGEDYTSDLTIDSICAALDATGAPAYIRVADDLRGVVREEGLAHDKLEFWPAKETDQ